MHYTKAGPVPKLAVPLLLSIWVIFVASSVGAQGVANTACVECHAEVGEAFAATPHGTYLSGTAAATHSCEACHGSGTAHVASGDPKDILNPAAADGSNGNELCLSCHNSNRLADWPASHHSTADVSCTSCHSVHTSAATSLKKDTPELCYDCHVNVKAASMMPSHHPIAEGRMDCTDCHGIHGESAQLAMDGTGRELCFSCHADKEGPFVYEHAPVNEDCSICHSPHGTVADNLLKQTEPSLCLSCHSMHFHASVESVDGNFTVPLDPSRNASSTPDGWKQAMLTKCTQCHTMVHGSDLPSQAASTGGNALTR